MSAALVFTHPGLFPFTFHKLCLVSLICMNFSRDMFLIYTTDIMSRCNNCIVHGIPEGGGLFLFLVLPVCLFFIDLTTLSFLLSDRADILKSAQEKY